MKKISINYSETHYYKLKFHIDKNKLVYIGIALVIITSLIALLS